LALESSEKMWIIRFWISFFSFMVLK
jgi:hypothetical protein